MLCCSISYLTTSMAMGVAMREDRRDFMKVAAGIGVAAAGPAALADEVAEEMRRRLGYLAAPGDSPPDLLAQPSPPIDPWREIALADLRPPKAEPLFIMTGPATAAEWQALGHEPADAPTQVETLPDDQWLALFNHRFRAAAQALRDTGFAVPEGAPWTVRGDQAQDGRVRIDIGEPPAPDAHQRFFEFRPQVFYINREVELLWRFHPQYGDASSSWGYHCIHAAPEGFRATRPGSPGPTFHARYGAPIMTRRINDLPEIGNQPGHSRLRFALPSTTSHLHNAHTASESDGYPNDWLNPGEYWDHHYANFPSGHDDRERLSTLWYHDHRMDFTASNVYAGLDGFYFMFDQPGAGNGDMDDETQGWRLPSGDYDLPLIFHDLLFAQEIVARGEDEKETGRKPRRVGREQSTRWTFESAQDWSDAADPARGVLLADGTRKAITHVGLSAVADDAGKSADGYAPSPEVVFDGFNIDGVIGDRWSVNRRVQPLLKVKPRKYRLRLLNGGPSRFYDLFLHATGVSPGYRAAVFGPESKEKQSRPATQTSHQMLVVTGDGNFQPNPVLVNSVYLGVAQRVDVIVDFAAFGAGARVYLVNELEQENGRGPTERRIRQSDYATDQDFFDANAQVAFEVEAEPVEDESRFPLFFRDLPPVDLSEVRRERLWEFDYDGGLWTINGDIFDPNRVDAGIEQDSAEIWTFRNGGSGWHHPIHSHFTEFIILEQDGKPFSQGSIQSELTPPPAAEQAQAETRASDTGAAARFESAAAPDAEGAAAPPQPGASGFSTGQALREAFPAAPPEAREGLRRRIETLRRRDPEALRLESAPADDWRALAETYWETVLKPQQKARLERLHGPIADDDPRLIAIGEAALATLERFVGDDGAVDEAAVMDVLAPLMEGRPQDIRFRRHAHFAALAAFLPQVGLRQPMLPDPARFMGGPRRDVALLLPNTEVTVFMRWKDFMGRHVMHCHNVVHEDHAMMIRWDIVPRGKGFDTPRSSDSVAHLGRETESRRRKHIEVHPPGGAHKPDDS